jgi:hypothetical protein
LSSSFGIARPLLVAVIEFVKLLKLEMMKVRIVYVIWTTLILSACKKNDLPRVPDPISYGTISFEDVLNSPSTTTISTQDKFKTLQVYSVVCAPLENNMQTRIYAWNGYDGAEFRAITMTINGGYDDFPLENQTVSIGFLKGQLTQTLALVNNPNPTPRKEDFIPAFAHLQGTYVSSQSVSLPVTFTEFQTNVASENRKIKASIPQVIIGSDTLKAFEIDINAFGGILTPTSKCMTFDANDKPAGSFTNQAFHAIGIDKKPGITTLEAEFLPDSRNPIVSLTFDFVHHSSRLAYNGPVGRHDLTDGTGYTEIKITAVDQNGVVYREQKGYGYVRVLYEKPWSELISFPTNTIFPGWILMEFQAELISDSGVKMTLKNGNAYYSILD